MADGEKKGWLARNLKVLIPCGCLGAVLMCLAFGFGVTAVVMGAIKSSDAYTSAMARVRADARVTGALGSPIDDGFFVAGNVNVTPASGVANLQIPISGPNGKGRVYLESTKSVGEWTFAVLRVELATGETIDLLSGTGD